MKSTLFAGSTSRFASTLSNTSPAQLRSKWARILIVNHHRMRTSAPGRGITEAVTRRPILRPVWMTFVIGFCAIQTALVVLRAASLSHALQLFLLSALLGAVIWLFHAGTLRAALTGAVVAACLVNTAPGLLHSALPGTIAMFLLTLSATRFRRGEKTSLGLAESKRGRSAAQVVANVGSAAAFAALAAAAAPHLRAILLTAVVAALAEATADTLASEFGESFAGRVVLVSNWKVVPAGTDGGISLKGTLAGLLGAGIVVGVCELTMPLGLRASALALFAAIAGLILDSFLGATLEARGYLENNAVNFLSTLASALIATALVAI